MNGVVVVEREQGELGARRGLAPGARSAGPDAVVLSRRERGVASISATSAPPAIQYGIGSRRSAGIASTRRRVAGLWKPIPYWITGGADVAETSYTPFAGEKDAAPVRLIVRQVEPTPGSQLALFMLYDYRAFSSPIATGRCSSSRPTTDTGAPTRTRSGLRDGPQPPAGGEVRRQRCLAVQVMAHNLAAGRRGSGWVPGSSPPRPPPAFSSGPGGSRPLRRRETIMSKRWPRARPARLRAIPLLA